MKISSDQMIWTQSLKDAQQALEEFLSNEQNIQKCAQFSELLISTLKAHHTVFSCGNGGSHCDAMHFAEELTGRYRENRIPLGALALGDPSHVTCVSNDFGFEFIFARQLSGLARAGDLLIVLSTSGNSPNLLKALSTAKEIGIKTVALLGKGGGKAKDLADLWIVVPGKTSDRIQEIHIKLLHIVIETMEAALFKTSEFTESKLRQQKAHLGHHP